MELDFCSSRVKERSLAPRFQGSVEECEEFLKKKDHFFCHFHFPNSNGEITIYGQLSDAGKQQVIQNAKYFTNVQGPALAFLDALVELCHKRDHYSLPLLRLREIDSFLRTKNTEPAFPDDGQKLSRYYEVIHALKSSITKNKMSPVDADEAGDDKKSPTMDEYRPHPRLLFDRSNMGEFLDLNDALKVQIVNDILLCHVRPLLKRDGGDVECIHVMENLVVVNFHGSCGSCSMSLTTTMDFIKKVLRAELYETSIDIITDS